MTTIDTHPEATAGAAASSGSGQLLAHVGSWVTTSDHKRIGRLFIGLSLTFLMGVVGLGAVLGLDRVQADDSDTVLSINSLGQLFSLFRVGLVFMAIVPLALVPTTVGTGGLGWPGCCCVLDCWPAPAVARPTTSF